MAHKLLKEIRQRFQRCCGYCGVHEDCVGGELTVDHFRPRTHGGDDKLANLVYACFRCNLYKGDYFPTDEDLRSGRRVLHPHRDNLAEHVRLDATTGLLIGVTAEGQFPIELLRLNRPQLVQFRVREVVRQYTDVELQWLRDENNRLREATDLNSRYLKGLSDNEAP